MKQPTTTVHDELSKLVPVLTETARRQDPERATACDCVHWDGESCRPTVAANMYKTDRYYIVAYDTCPTECDCYQPRNVT
jgi:hypothetical protein